MKENEKRMLNIISYYLYENIKFFLKYFNINYIFSVIINSIILSSILKLDLIYLIISSQIITLFYNLLLYKKNIPIYFTYSYILISPIFFIIKNSTNNINNLFLVYGIILFIVSILIKKYGLFWLNFLINPVILGMTVILISINLLNTIWKIFYDNYLYLNYYNFIITIFTFLMCSFFFIKKKNLSYLFITYSFIISYILSIYLFSWNFNKINNICFHNYINNNNNNFYDINILLSIPFIFVVLMEYINYFIILLNINNNNNFNINSFKYLSKSIFYYGCIIIISSLFKIPPVSICSENINILYKNKNIKYYFNSIIYNSILIILISIFLKKYFILYIPLSIVIGIYIFFCSIIFLSGIKILPKLNEKNYINNISLILLIFTLGSSNINYYLSSFSLYNIFLSFISGILLNIFLKFICL